MRLGDILKQAGWDDADIPTAASIIIPESGGNPKIHNTHASCGTRKDGSKAYAIGLMQICTIHLDPGGLLDGWTEADLETAQGGARAGLIVFKAQSWGAWAETYNTGRYKAYPKAVDMNIAVNSHEGSSLSAIARSALSALPGGAALVPGANALGLPDIPNPVDAVGDVAGAVTGAVKTLTDPKTWFTLGKVYFGGVLILIGVGGLVFVVAKTVVNSSPGQAAMNVASAAGGPATKAAKVAGKIAK